MTSRLRATCQETEISGHILCKRGPGVNNNFQETCCPSIHGLRPKELYARVSAPATPVRVPSQ